MKRQAKPFNRSIEIAIVALSLVAASDATAQSIYQWNGVTNSNWPAGTNWQGGSVGTTGGSFNARLNVYNGGGSVLVYSSAQGNTIYANAAGRGLVISLASGSVAGSMEVNGGSFSTLGSTQADVIGNNATGSLTISGTGSFTGAATFAGGAVGTTAGGTVLGLNSAGGTSTLTISGNGSATLSTFYMAGATATVNLNGGALTANQIVDVDNLGAPGSSNTTFNFNGGTLTAGSAAVTNFMAGLSRANVLSGGAFIDTSGKDITIGQALLAPVSGISGGLTKLGAGTLKLTQAATYTGATTVNQGILELAAPNASGGGLFSSSGITVNNTGTILVSNDNALHGFGGTAGTVTINAGGSMTTANNITSHIRGPLSLNGGTLASGTPTTLYGSWALYGDVTATGTTISTISASDVFLDGTRTFTVSDAAGNLDVTGYFRGGALTKSGAGTMTLSGANTYTGATNVDNGKLVVNGNISTSTLTTVGSNGTLGGTGTVGDTMVNGIFAPGSSIGTLNINGALALAGTANFEIDPTSGLGLNRSSDLANVSGTITYGGILNVLYGGSASDFTSGMVFNLFDGASFTGSFSSLNLPSLTSGLSWQDNLATNGTLAVVPEPGAGLLGGLGMFALLRRRR